MGEAKFGLLDGVITTRAGFVGQDEVVEVGYDPERIAYDKLLRQAKSLDCANKVFVSSHAEREAARRTFAGSIADLGRFRPDEESKYYLRQTPLRSLPMTELQAARVNASLEKDAYLAFLSPRQRQLAKTIAADKERDWPLAIGADMTAAWTAATSCSDHR